MVRLTELRDEIILFVGNNPGCNKEIIVKSIPCHRPRVLKIIDELIADEILLTTATKPRQHHSLTLAVFPNSLSKKWLKFYKSSNMANRDFAPYLRQYIGVKLNKSMKRDIESIAMENLKTNLKLIQILGLRSSMSYEIEQYAMNVIPKLIKNNNLIFNLVSKLDREIFQLIQAKIVNFALLENQRE